MIIVKLCLPISSEVQPRRPAPRAADPLNPWTISEEDGRNRGPQLIEEAEPIAQAPS
jgi:polyphosphate kinase 2 (PPK2 family)